MIISNLSLSKYESFEITESILFLIEDIGIDTFPKNSSYFGVF